MTDSKDSKVDTAAADPKQKAEAKGGESKQAAKRTIDVEVISDLICPFCFVGKRRLEKAIASLDASKYDVKINWKPFFLDPTLPSPGVDKMEHYKKKFGAQRTQMMIPAMIERGKADGIKFSYAGKVGNTMAGHRLVEWSKQFGKHEQLMEELFTRYFEQEQDVADTDTLVAAAKKVGLDGDAAAKFLKTSEGKEEVMASVQEAYSNDVTGVPFFILNGKYAFSGAQDVDFFKSVFNKAIAAGDKEKA